MPDILRIKRRSSGGAGAPASLAYAELAYNEVNDVLYYGKGDNAGQAVSIIPIAGPGFVSAGGSTVAIGDTPPASPTDGQLWWETDTAILWLRYNDGNSTQWTSVSAPPGPAMPFLPLTGGTLTGNVVISKTVPSLVLDHSDNTSASLYGSRGLLSRWRVELGNNAAETATDGVGSDFIITRYHNDGSSWSTPFWISRQTGNVTVANNLLVSNYLEMGGGQSDGAFIFLSTATLSGNATTALQAVPKQQLDASVSTALNNVGRNLLHNGLFNVQQRGTGAWTANGYGADRWINGFGTTGGSFSASLGAMTAATAAVFSDEAAQYNWQGSHTAGTGAGDFFILRQFMENLRRFAGKTVTLSFWAWCNSGTPKICVELAQVFGSGGSPSASVNSIGMTVITINTTPTRYSVTISIPSVAGKTFGTTAGSDFMEVNLWMSAGSTYSTSRAGGIGFQSGVWLFWGIQLEFGSIMTQLEKVDPQVDLANCRRFYQVNTCGGFGYQATATDNGYRNWTWVFNPPMRITPTVTFITGGSVPVMYSVSPTGLAANLSGVAASSGAFSNGYNASADF